MCKAKPSDCSNNNINVTHSQPDIKLAVGAIVNKPIFNQPRNSPSENKTGLFNGLKGFKFLNLSLA
jgi:hypothetical protein